MKTTRALALATILALGIQAAAAQGSAPSASPSSSPDRSKKAMASPVRLSKLMDAKVHSKTGEDLGQLEDLLIEPKTGEIKFAVLGQGGALGIGEKYVPVPWKAIQVQSESQFTLNVDKNKLQSAPTTDKDYANLQDPGYTVTIYRFFAVPAETEMGAGENIEQSQPGTESTTNTPGATESSSEADTSRP